MAFGYSRIASSLHSTHYRPDIDGLRAVAVSAVVIGHAFPSVLPGGFIGVDIFFVLSGYLISSILIGDLEQGRFSLLRFYDRRIRRIFPALLAVLLAVTAIGWLILLRSEFRTLGGHVAASALFSENFLLWSESGYFDESSQAKPLLHLWSLAIEEQFYIFWPMILYGARRCRISFIVLFAILFAISFAANLHDIVRDPTAAYYSPAGRFWELIVGAGLAYVKAHRPDLLDRFRNAQSAVGAILIIAALALITPERAFPGLWALLPTIGTALLVSGGARSWVNRKILATRPFVWCGLISYPLYLWHWPLLSYAFIVSGWVSPVKALLLIAVAVMLAATTFFLIERPFRRRSQGAAQPILLVIAMVAILGCGTIALNGLIAPRLSHFNEPSRTTWDFLRSRTPHFDDNGIGLYPLHADRPALALFIGDSHLAQYAERIDRMIAADPHRLGAIMAVGGGCNPIEGVFADDVRRTKCWPLRARAYRMALESRFRTIVIGGSWSWYFHTPGYTYGSLSLASDDGRAAALAQLAHRISALVAAGKKVVLVLDNPQAPALDPASTSRLVPSSADFVPNRTASIQASQRELQRELATTGRSAGAVIVDPFGAVCTQDMCRVTTETGMPLFADVGHFNPDWAIGHAAFIDVTTDR